MKPESVETAGDEAAPGKRPLKCRAAVAAILLAALLGAGTIAAAAVIESSGTQEKAEPPRSRLTTPFKQGNARGSGRGRRRQGIARSSEKRGRCRDHEFGRG